MLEQIASSKFGFWIVAAMIAAIDSAFLLKPGRFAFSISQTNQVGLRVSPYPFTLRNQEFISSLISFPFQLFFVSDVDAPDRTTEQTLRLLSRMSRLARRTATLSILSILAALTLITGPCIAAFRGIQTSIAVMLPLLYVLAIAASVVLWQMRKTFGLSTIAALKIAAELVLCPVLLVNISKKLALSQSPRLNVLNVASYSASPQEALAAIRDNLSYYRGE